MERLEISELAFSELYSGVRIDAEFYDKKLIEVNKRLKLKGFCYLGDIAKTITDMGAFSLYKTEYFVCSGVPFLRVNNIKKNFLDLTETLFITNEYHNILSKSKVKYKDVLLTTKAVIGISCTVGKNIGECNMSQNLVRITINEEKYNPYYISTFLNSKFGHIQTNKSATGNVQLYLNFEKIKSIKIPFAKIDFQNQIQEIIELSEQKRKLSIDTYEKAENDTLNEMGFLNFKPSTNPINIKSFKKSFIASGRLDAEFFQIKHEEIESKIIKNSFYSIKDVFQLLSNPSPSFYTETGTKVIKTKNIRIPSIEIENITDHTNEERILIQKNDLLFASMGVGSLGRISYIDNEIDNCTSDGTIRILRVKEKFKNQNFEIPTLLFLTSKFGQELIYKYVIGSTGIISISKENIENLIVPKISLEANNRITELVLQSQKLKKESENLLELAKRSVEIAIEQNEEIALQYISDKI